MSEEMFIPLDLPPGRHRGDRALDDHPAHDPGYVGRHR